MTSITVRNVPEDTRDELAARAARSGRSLQEYLKAELIDLARRPDMGEVMDRIRQRKAGMAGGLSAEKILEYRDAGRR